MSVAKIFYECYKKNGKNISMPYIQVFFPETLEDMQHIIEDYVNTDDVLNKELFIGENSYNEALAILSGAKNILRRMYGEIVQK